MNNILFTSNYGYASNFYDAPQDAIKWFKILLLVLKKIDSQEGKGGIIVGGYIIFKTFGYLKEFKYTENTKLDNFTIV